MNRRTQLAFVIESLRRVVQSPEVLDDDTALVIVPDPLEFVAALELLEGNTDLSIECSALAGGKCRLEVLTLTQETSK
jgi:hypothetical protein